MEWSDFTIYKAWKAVALCVLVGVVSFVYAAKTGGDFFTDLKSGKWPRPKPPKPFKDKPGYTDAERQ